MEIFQQLSANAIRRGQVTVSRNRIFQNLLRVEHFTIAVPSLIFEPSNNRFCGKVVSANELTGMAQSIVTLRRRQMLIDVSEKRLHHRGRNRQSFPN